MTTTNTATAPGRSEHTAGPSVDRPAPTRRWHDAVAVVVGTLLITWHGTSLGRWLVDDAAITFAYARSIDEGLGPVQQPGAEPVEGYSNPTWLALLVIGRRLGLFDRGSWFGVPDLVLFPKLLAVLCAAGILLAIAWAAHRLVARPWVVTGLAGVLLAANLSFVAWMFSGLENPLYALLATVLAAALVRAVTGGTLLTRRTAITCGLLALAAALTRPDGLVLAGAYPLLLLVTLRRPELPARLRAAAYGIGAFALPYALFLVLRHAEFGRIVPNTAVAKSQGLPDIRTFAQTSGELLSFAGWPTVVVTVAVCAVALARRGRLAAGLLGVLVPLGLALFAFGVLDPDWMGMYRFATPVWALGAMALSLAAVSLAEQAVPHRRALLSAAVGASLLFSVVAQWESAADFRAKPTLSLCMVVKRHGVLFNEYADRLGVRNASLLTPSLGGTLLTSKLKVHDLAGLTEPRIADYLAAGDIKGLQAYALDKLHPTFVHATDNWADRTGMKEPLLASKGYVPLYRTSDGTGAWVRSDAVRHPERLPAVRAWTRRVLPTAYTEDRQQCGQHLTPGLTAAGAHWGG
ncbi:MULTISPECIES: hypothetical protein [unclassified Streptomyces]|uniref:hypothetical protein n=1 Tax=unclassified Streptomyces TaxID=2593676 RepID=UPI002E19AC12